MSLSKDHPHPPSGNATRVAASTGALHVDGHYENFPVASWLVPHPQRPLVVAFYRFARHADDIADEGDAPATLRRARLASIAADIERLWASAPDGPASLTPSLAPVVAGLAPLRKAMPGLSRRPFLDLLSAFAQDIDKHRYDDRTELLDYCTRSANPVGRVMLRLFDIDDAEADRMSDAICTSLQLINFWQDAAIDAGRGRVYVPLADLARHGLSADRFPAAGGHGVLMQEMCAWALASMQEGAPLLGRLRGRFRWEIALTIAGGTRVLQKIAAAGFDVRERPTLRWYDAPSLLRLAVAVLRRGADALTLASRTT